MPIGNLRGLANVSTRVVNKNVVAELRKNIGYDTSSTGKRTPKFRRIPIEVQVQALEFSDLQQLDGLNIQGVRRAIYTNSQVASVIRVRQKGGDLLVFAAGVLPEGTTWLAVHVLERWPDWCKIAITLQEDELDINAC